jgi:hypothetical protein
MLKLADEKGEATAAARDAGGLHAALVTAVCKAAEVGGCARKEGRFWWSDGDGRRTTLATADKRRVSPVKGPRAVAVSDRDPCQLRRMLCGAQVGDWQGAFLSCCLERSLGCCRRAGVEDSAAVSSVNACCRVRAACDGGAQHVVYRGTCTSSPV